MPRCEEYAVWSEQHGKWWAPGSRGYRSEFSEAGRYSREEAFDICRTALYDGMREHRLTEVPVRVSRMIAYLEARAPSDKPARAEGLPVDSGDVREFIETSPIAALIIQRLGL